MNDILKIDMRLLTDASWLELGWNLFGLVWFRV